MENLGSIIFHSFWHCDSGGGYSCAGEECFLAGNELTAVMDEETINRKQDLSGTVLFDLAGTKV